MAPLGSELRRCVLTHDMAKRRHRDSQRFRIFEDERTGLEYGFVPITSYPNAYTRESGKPVLDQGLKVAPSEFDSPPPSKKSLGGADISGDVRANSDFATPSNVNVIPPESTKIIVSVNSSTSISWNKEPVVYIAPALANQTMAVNPQIVAGTQSQQITLQCVGSNVTLLNGSGLTLYSANYLMGSGALLSLFYSQTDNTWHETSRGNLYTDTGFF